MCLVQTKLCVECVHVHTVLVHMCTHTHSYTHSGTRPLQNTISIWYNAVVSLLGLVSCLGLGTLSILLGFGYQHPSLSCHCLTLMKAVFPEYFSHQEQMSEELGWGPAWCPLLLSLTLCWLCSLLLPALRLLPMLRDKVTQQRKAENKVTQTHLSALRKGFRLLGTCF